MYVCMCVYKLERMGAFEVLYKAIYVLMYVVNSNMTHFNSHVAHFNSQVQHVAHFNISIAM